MTDEVTKAAERLRRLCEYGGGEFVDQIYRPEHGHVFLQQKADESRLVAAYLSTVAVDEHVAIDAAWLLSVGFKADADGWFYLQADYGDLIEFLLPECVVCVFGNQLPQSFVFTTRGQLRQLCRALGIALKPSGQEEGK